MIYRITSRFLNRILFLASLTLLSVACTHTPESVNSTKAKDNQLNTNKAAVTQYLESMGTSDFGAIAAAVRAPNFTEIRHEYENLKYNADDPSIAKVMQPVHQALTEQTTEITRMMAEGDMVATTVRIKATHTGNFYGIPATGKNIDIQGGAVFKLNDGKIVESWILLEEARLLRQIGARLPKREDGKINLPPVYNDTRTFDEGFAEHTANPVDTPEYRHSRLLFAYKSKVKPDDYKFTGRPYTNLQRGGIANIVERGAELGVEGSHGASMSDRQDTIAHVISEGDFSMMQFRLNSKNSGPLYGIPASNNDLHDWELGFARFVGDKWVDAWWMADELAFILTIGNEEALEFFVSEEEAVN